MSLYIKYRPSKLDEVLGNQEVIFTLTQMMKDVDTCPHSFLLSGPTGCGKTTIARIISKELGCIGSDFNEVDSADFRGIDTIRDIRKASQYMPLEGNCKVWLLDECHKLSNDAQNALLKTLEDTPKKVYFILATTDPQKLIATIRGRCATFQLKPLSDTDMLKLLRRIVRAEQKSINRAIYDLIIRNSEGLPRNALNILEQVLLTDEGMQEEIVNRYAEQQSQTIELCRALLGGKGWKTVADILTGLKTEEPENIRRAVLGYCQAVLLKGDNMRAGAIMEAFIEPFYNSSYPGLVFACYSVVKS
jgi:DNA polymerase-3 subunit gamma/tau